PARSVLRAVAARRLRPVSREQFDATPKIAAWPTISLFFVLRVVTIRFNWQTQPVWRNGVDRRK
ncbi:MAG: hypothetical protein ACJ8KO_13095, partial [Sulfurifustaceae bacterium]